MRCPHCAATDTKVVDKRETPDERAARRRRECLKCHGRFTTYERVEEAEVFVAKKDGTRQPFDGLKIKRGLLRAAEKRPITMEQIDQLISEVETEIRKKGEKEVPTKTIGKIIMDKLIKLDKVAYIRFASVYRDFSGPRSFEKEIQLLAKVKA